MYNFCKIPCIFIICFFLILTGCWDSLDIERLNIHLGTALDKAPSTDDSKDGYRKKNIIKLTTQNIAHEQKSGQSDQGGQPQNKYENMTGTGDSIIEIVRGFSSENDHPSFGQHLKVIVIGEELAREMSLQLLLNQHSRTSEVRDSCIILIAHGSAADTLKISGDVPSLQLIGIENNKYKTAKLLPTLTLGKTESKMDEHSNYIIQSVHTKNKKVIFNGGAIFKGETNKLIGFLNEEEATGLNWITGNIKGGLVKGKDPKTKNLIVYNISSATSTITPHLNGNQITFDVNIKSTGNLNEDWVMAGNAFSNKFLKRSENAIKEEIERLIRQTMNKLQKEYQVDVAGFGEQLRIHYPQEWNFLKKDWNKQFTNVSVKYEINIVIDNYMIEGKKELAK
ncbi:Ger(x)C family spore germination protein [Shimazuella kribbensis]|uniref:Ger(x)C family spore germination protein n=1 Tax=Shimazuella kribbensis TaxID=139808 RepID=UPI0003FF4982|nr:Ger(x)C family spore germination protein [Shimazuella kribbensis]